MTLASLLPPSTRIGVAVAVSLALHALTFSVALIPPPPPQMARDSKPLEVVLVNAKSRAASLAPDALAQANLAGGGNTDDDRKLASPLPVSAESQAAQRTAELAKRVQKLEEKARSLMTRLKTDPELAQPKPAISAAEFQRQAREQALQEAREMAELQARIAQQQSEYQKRPKRAFVGANVKEYVFARYVEDWVAKVERIGNLNYPEAARRQRLYGSLQVTASVQSDGSIEKIVIDRSSGSRILDAAAEKIVRMGAPYAAFPAEMREKADILDITRTWTFTRSDQLSGGD